jgi:hypothetical protein
MTDPDPLVVQRRFQQAGGGWSPWTDVLNGHLIGDSLRVFLDPAGSGEIEVREPDQHLVQYRFQPGQRIS